MSEQKHYLITGATSGVGREVSRALQAQVHSVLLLGRNRPALDEELGSSTFSEAVSIDFERFPMCDLTELIRQRGPFDGVFHAAGSELILPLRLTADALYRKAMTFADSTFAILRAAAMRDVMKPGGSVVIMSSVAAHRGTAGMTAYSAARASVEGMARAAAIELADKRIRVNCVAAGAFQSALHERVTNRMPQSARDAYAAAHPLGIGKAEAVRDTVLHLLSDEARWTTGTTVVVDGGYLAR